MTKTKRIISKEEYFARIEQGISIGDCWVDMGNGQLAYALQEIVIVPTPINKYKDKKFESSKVNLLLINNNITNAVGHTEFVYNLWVDGIPNASKYVKNAGKGLTGAAIVVDALSVSNQFESGGIKNVNPIDATSLSTGIVGVLCKLLSKHGLSINAISVIGELAGMVGMATSIFQMWWEFIYKPMDDLRFAPLYIDKNGESYWGEPYWVIENQEYTKY